jgi:hypothetical protein
VSVSDPEDGTINCSRVTVAYLLGHDSHNHEITRTTGCSGTITVPTDGEHDAAANVYGVFQASYTDNGGLTSTSTRTLQPKHRQGEHFGTQSGVQVAAHAAAEGGSTAGFIENNDWIAYTPYALQPANRFTARVSSAGSGGTIEVRAGSSTGTLLGSVAVPVTGSWETFTNVTAALNPGPAGTTSLYLVFKGGAGNLFDVDAFTLDTGAPPAGAATLKALVNTLFVSAENGTAPLIANRTTVGPWEQFDVVDQGGGVVALRARSNGMFVCAENAGADPLVANRATVGAWERFVLVRNADGSESLRAEVNNMYVTAENAGAAPLVANRAAIGAWERFDLVTP